MTLQSFWIFHVRSYVEVSLGHSVPVCSFNVDCGLLVLPTRNVRFAMSISLNLPSCHWHDLHIIFMSYINTYGYSCFHFSITAQKLKFSIKDFFSKCNQIRSFLRIWSHLLKKSLMVNFSFSAMNDLLLRWILLRLFKIKQLLQYSFYMIFISKLFFNWFNTEKASQRSIDLTFILTKTYWQIVLLFQKKQTRGVVRGRKKELKSPFKY